MSTRMQIASMSTDALIAAAVACTNRCDAELLNAEVRRRAYLAKHGTFVTERMSPWAVEKREEIFGWRPSLRPARTRN